MNTRHFEKPDNREQPAEFIVLALGSIAAIACTFGPSWMARVGVALALVTAVVAVSMTRRSMKQLEETHRNQLSSERRSAAEASAWHHEEMMAMIRRFGARREALEAELRSSNAQLAETRMKLAASHEEERLLRSSNGLLADASVRQRHRIADLEARIAEVQEELDEMYAQEYDLDKIVDLPTRRPNPGVMDDLASDVG